MRKILFKAKRIDNGKWVTGDLVHVRTKDGEGVGIKDTISHVNDGYFDLTPRIAHEETVCQYTGLNDRCGNPIFEGDLLAANSLPIINVKSGDITGIADPKYVEVGLLKIGRFSMRTATSIESLSVSRWSIIWSPESINKYFSVIGNIHDAGVNTDEFNHSEDDTDADGTEYEYDPDGMPAGEFDDCQ